VQPINRWLKQVMSSWQMAGWNNPTSSGMAYASPSALEALGFSSSGDRNLDNFSATDRL
jgi:hypothetical protein